MYYQAMEIKELREKLNNFIPDHAKLLKINIFKQYFSGIIFLLCDRYVPVFCSSTLSVFFILITKAAYHIYIHVRKTFIFFNML